MTMIEYNILVLKIFYFITSKENIRTCL